MDTCNLSYQGIGCQIEIHKKIERPGLLTCDGFNRQYCISQIIKWGSLMNTDNFTNVSISIDEANRTGCKIVANRPPSHPKGEKTLMDIRYGDPIPPDIILSKDTLILIKDFN
jgi:hypothetical protein